MDTPPRPAHVPDLAAHRAARRTAIAAAIGVVASGIAAAGLLAGDVLVGWSTVATVYCARARFVSRSMDAGTTKLHATSEDDSRVVADITLLAVCVASLVAVGLALVKAAETGGTGQAVFTGIAVLSVVMAWVLVHTVFTLRYGRSYYGDTAAASTSTTTAPPTTARTSPTWRSRSA